MNALNIITPYKHNGMWVFDDPAVGLSREPFVAGADTMIDVLTKDIPNTSRGFNLIFSANHFMGYEIMLHWLREDMGGNIYNSAYLGMECWLCPVLLKYFQSAPERIYIQIKGL